MGARVTTAQLKNGDWGVAIDTPEPMTVDQVRALQPIIVASVPVRLLLMVLFAVFVVTD